MPLYDARGYVSAETLANMVLGMGLACPLQAGWHVQKASPTVQAHWGNRRPHPSRKEAGKASDKPIPRNINKSWKQHEVTAQGKHKANKHKGQTRSTRQTSTRDKHKGKTRSTREAQERHTRQQQQQQETKHEASGRSPAGCIAQSLLMLRKGSCTFGRPPHLQKLVVSGWP
jgi:hypothetical protein